jgi:hypothetical protein
MSARTIEDDIVEVKKLYESWVLGSVKQTYDATKDWIGGSTPLAAFILVSCAIDFLAGFYCGIESFLPKGGESSKNYKAFVAKYMPQYEPYDVYSNIRCRLAHNYTIGGSVALTHRHPELHDPKGAKGRKIVNFEEFLADFRNAATSYFNDVKSNSALRRKFAKRLVLGVAGTEIM